MQGTTDAQAIATEEAVATVKAEMEVLMQRNADLEQQLEAHAVEQTAQREAHLAELAAVQVRELRT